MKSTTDQVIEEFVRGPLGCNCPAKVFEKIELIDKPSDFDDWHNSQIIEIGGILLVLVISTDNWQEIQPELESLFKRGIKVRDTKKFNRFRLVVATQDAEKAKRALEQDFESLSKNDEKIHLHVVTPEELPSATLV